MFIEVIGAVVLLGMVVVGGVLCILCLIYVPRDAAAPSVGVGGRNPFSKRESG